MSYLVNRYKKVRNILDKDCEVIEVCIKHADFDRPSSTDPSYYVPSSEIAKQANKVGRGGNCLYDNCDVDKKVMDLRRPGLDVSEQIELAKKIVDDCESEASYNAGIRADNVKKAYEDMKKVNARNEFIDKSMSASVPTV